VKIELEALAIVEGELRMTLVAREERVTPRPVRKCSGVHVINTTGETVADVVPLRAVGGAR
jgi:hypothetical protein